MDSKRPIATAPAPSGATTERAAPFGPLPDGRCSRRRRAAIALVGIAAFVLYAVESVFRQQQFKSSVDITIFQQAIANYAQGRAPDVLVKSQEPFNILGDHFSPIVIVLAPFYRIWPSVVTLLIAQAFLLAVGVHVVTRVAVARLGGLGYYIGISFALSWGILKVLDFDFHEACFAVAFLALAMEALIDDRRGRLLLWCGALLLVKEDTPLFIAGIGLVFAATREWRWAIGFLASSVAAFGLLTTVVIPYFSYSGTYTYFAQDANDPANTGPTALAGAILQNFVTVNGLALLGALAVTAAFGLRSPLILVLIPTLLARFASDREVYLQMKFYYDGPLMVICAVALVVALQQRRLRLGRTTEQIHAWWFSASGLATGLLLFVLVDYNVHTSELPLTLAAQRVPDQWALDAVRLINEIPAGETVIADVGLIGNLADSHPALLAAPDWRDSTHLPLDADWVLLNLNGDEKAWKVAKTEQLLSQGYGLVDHAGTLVLLQR
jgi:uncharacterized membrane protein